MAQKTAHFGPSVGKTESTAAMPPKFRSFYPLELFGLIHKRPDQDPFFCQKPVFTHRRVRIHGASGTKLPFRCNSLRRSTPAGPKGRKAPMGPFSPLGQSARFARRLENLQKSLFGNKIS